MRLLIIIAVALLAAAPAGAQILDKIRKQGAITLGYIDDAVRRGRADLECSTTTWTLSRQRLVDFSLVLPADPKRG